MDEPERPRRRLPSFRGTPVIGGFLGGLEQLILHRPPPAEVAESHQVSDTLHGLTVDDPEIPRRPDPPDTSGARL
ncbi:MAG TPA: hypothetical protein VFJ03_06290 [Candidatus Limnocylindria bacterium]|jgi:hypothetical protein|nr:hypothetical protein [Candidatus Limnocylindria bacterium]